MNISKPDGGGVSRRIVHRAWLAALATCACSAGTTGGRDASVSPDGPLPPDLAASPPDQAGPAPDLARPFQCQGVGPTGYNPYKYAFYGDLHLHTSYSLDAYSFATRSDPANAYLFAKGQATVHVGSGTSGLPGPDITQSRPLDFLAITDHSEWLAVTHGCTVDANSPYYNASDCGLVRSTQVADQGKVFAMLGTIRKDLCQNAADCQAQQMSAWQDLVSAASTAYSPCNFSSFVAYEWTDAQPVMNQATQMTQNVTNHRNVIFSSDKVPPAPLDSVAYPDPPSLWTALDAQCTAAMGCDVVTIPHNTNLSAGVSLKVWTPTPEGVARQHRYQVSAEIYQHKGNSECYYNPAQGYSDPDCQFEYITQARVVNPGPGLFVRQALGGGIGYLAENPAQENPLQLGILGATDDHNGAPGFVDEAAYVGHAGRLEEFPVLRLKGEPTQNGSGALTGAWAEQNTREAIFAAIKRRETFATSGPRIQVRFYQTADATACDDPTFPGKIVDGGALPMGSTFTGKAAKASFAISAWPDATPQQLVDDTLGVAGLAKVQVIKLHARASGGKATIVEDPPSEVAGIPAHGGCATWTDARFDPSEYAVYYVRVLQVPTWRWSHGSCAQLKKNHPADWQALAPGCAQGGGLDVTITERAWTSPIWFVP